MKRELFQAGTRSFPAPGAEGGEGMEQTPTDSLQPSQNANLESRHSPRECGLSLPIRREKRKSIQLIPMLAPRARGFHS